MTNSNPFLPTRFEFESSPLIWKSPYAFELEKQQSYFLKGTRGSGKTSILKSINWKEKLTNLTLVDQIDEESWSCIAVYFRLPDHMSQSINNIDWSQITPDAPSYDGVAYWYFSLLVEAISLEALLEAIIALRARQKLSFDLAREDLVINKVLEKYSELKYFDTSRSSSGLVRLKSIFDKLHHEINTAATRGTITQLLEKLPKTEGAEILLYVTDSLCELLGIYGGSRKFHFKICIDDCETLKEKQQIFLNSIVRKAKAPICWVISFVKSDYESASTVIHNQKLSDSDRKVIDLDEVSSAEFKKLCTAVTSLRVYYSLTEEQKVERWVKSPATCADLNRILGSLSINRLFSETTKGSLAKDLPRLREKAKKLSNEAKSKKDDNLITVLDMRDKRDLPLYQTYLIDRLYSGRSISTLVPDDPKKISAFSAMLRRKQVGAYLCMCSQYGVKNIAYAGCNVVLNMSDNCIRDFLELMGSIFDAFNDNSQKKLVRFANRREKSHVTISTQRKGIYQSSQNKLLGIKEGKDALDVLTSEVAKLVEGLGYLTAKLQSSHDDIQCLKTTERGVFIFDYTKIPALDSRDSEEMAIYIGRVVKRAVLDGLLRPESFSYRTPQSSKKQSLIGYRLHKRYCSKFGFSFRGAYEPMTADMTEIARLCAYSDDTNAREWANRTYEKMSVYARNQIEFEFDE